MQSGLVSRKPQITETSTSEKETLVLGGVDSLIKALNFLESESHSTAVSVTRSRKFSTESSEKEKFSLPINSEALDQDSTEEASDEKVEQSHSLYTKVQDTTAEMTYVYQSAGGLYKK